MDETEELQRVLSDKAQDFYGSDSTVTGLMRLSGGASRETWRFDVIETNGAVVPLILRRDPLLRQNDGSIATEDTRLGVSRAAEAQLFKLGAGASVPVPKILFSLELDDRTTAGFVMQRIEGETLGRRILREDLYAQARPELAYQCGYAAARFHGIPLSDLPELRSMNVRQEFDYYHELMNSFGHPYPGFEYGFRWLEERIELAGEGHALVHGDFRNGNIIVGEDGLRAVLDWESAHLGNPLNDLGWICVRAWRYGHLKKPVGGFGEVEELLAGYQAGGGGPVDPKSLHYWEVFGTLRWGILCIIMGFSHINGPTKSMEKAAIGRRTAETEYDLMQILD